MVNSIQIQHEINMTKFWRVLIPHVGKLYTLGLTFLIFYFVSGEGFHAFWYVPIYVVVSLTAFPFFRQDGLFWRKETPVPLWAWVLDSFAFGILLSLLFIALIYIL